MGGMYAHQMHGFKRICVNPAVNMSTMSGVLKTGEHKFFNGRKDNQKTFRIVDQQGVERSDGSRSFSPEEIMTMDWLCDNVEGSIPGYDELIPPARELVRLLGVYRDSIPPEKEEKQL